MCVRVCEYIYIYIYTYIYVYTCIYIYAGSEVLGYWTLAIAAPSPALSQPSSTLAVISNSGLLTYLYIHAYTNMYIHMA